MRTTVATVVVVGLVVLGAAALLFPAVQAAREAQRRLQCGDNVQQLCLGLQNYHDTFLYLPYGARNRSTPPDYDNATWGPSWLVSGIPFFGINSGYDAIYAASVAEPQTDFASAPVRSKAPNVQRFMKFVLCPSSPLPESQELSGVELLVPSYVGIMGATDEPTEEMIKQGRGFEDRRIVPGPYGGRAAGNGLLLINDSLSFDACTDGTAYTLLIGEVSDWYYTNTGERRNPALSAGDAGDGPSDAAGWMAGNNLPFTSQRVDRLNLSLPGFMGQFVTFDADPVPADRVCNLVTLNYAVGTNNRDGQQRLTPEWGTGGVGRCGLSNPLLSAHPAGAMVGYADGHVAMLTKGTAVWLIKKLAARDDGGVIDNGVD